MSTSESFTVPSTTGIDVPLSLYRSATPHRRTTILYLHGGGLVYGTRHDLPPCHLDAFLHAGYDVLAPDYPLAPESNLDTILATMIELIAAGIARRDPRFPLDNPDYVLFGRSAGAYLALTLCQALNERGIPGPKAIISLYGYARLDDPAFLTPSKHYSSFPSLSPQEVERIVGHTPVTDGDINTRFALYVTARQQGSWIGMLCGDAPPARYSLDAAQLATFPPTFLAAATMDPDVPYRMSKSLSRTIPGARLMTVYGETHDFDRDTRDPTGASVYAEIMSWLDER
ncbi:alpha/beta hydrolase [Propionivibrio dicarboxylicus]|uniref:Acetyl esterase/lipase n=1 Tax=Propionivibrio dicarboxylicus TaxID=83767 RepID=A0A1G8GRX3_9RHOO|nr:alpha/beta hydrolase [Propionivibrio dicarboxylicus]SDH97155.1 Acetyl esterase/lipase [Propionivibrio dicarboxylicus]